MPDESRKKMETDLGGHTREKTRLHPPFKRLEGMVFASWANDRLPEMLWAVLVVGNWDREIVLGFFRYVAQYVEKNKECWDVTLSGIGKLSSENRSALIKHMVAWSADAPRLLKALLIFPNLPGKSEWEAHLPASDFEEDIGNLADGVNSTLWHQSESATDCRWIHFLCVIMADKMKFSSEIEDIRETLRGVYEYPNYGDLRHIRPFIRASEISLGMPDNQDHSWADHFWDICFKQTQCIPESLHVQDVYEPDKWDEERNHLMSETARVRKSVITHSLDTMMTTTLDYRHEGVFGLVMYGQQLLDEIVLMRLNYLAAGRLALRAIVETCITLAYLVKKDDPPVWAAYREHGSGQAKLVHLKLDELKDIPSFIDRERIERIANEDKWQEYLSINLGHWDDSNLRELSTNAGLKDVYDRYYAWSSGYVHGNWAAVRDTAFEKCLNPLHRFHRIPKLGIPKLADVVPDAVELTNKMLDLLDKAYPNFSDRVNPAKKEPEEPKKSEDPEEAKA